jgi:regulation of enolase protein 1 (concanavalin A-like superfamily)
MRSEEIIVFPGDFVILKGEYRWRKVIDCDGGMMMQLSDDRWVEASAEYVGDLKSKYEYEALVTGMAREIDKLVMNFV